MNFSRFINHISSQRLASPLRKITEIQEKGGESLISFGTGAPNASCFPFNQIRVTTKYGQQIDLSGADCVKALQYGPTKGNTALVEWLKRLQLKMHSPPTMEGSGDSKLDLLITPGSQDGLSKIMEMVLNPNDYILMEEPSYPGTLAALRPMDLKCLLVRSDSDGMIPDSLREILSKWKPSDSKDPGCLIPKLLYLQPNYNNPTGASISLDRRKEILQIAKEYDLLIVEDDPYFFLGFDSDFVPSFLSMDTEGRVLRLDSFSKILSSGMRIGFVTGAKVFIERLMLALQVSSMHCNSLSQMLALHYLENVGIDGFLVHTRKTADFYKSQCLHLEAAANKHLEGLVEYSVPKGGMFLWMKVDGVSDTTSMIMDKGLKEKVVFVPGSMFCMDPETKSPYLRASFSNVSPENMDEGLQRLANLIRAEKNNQD